MFFKHLKAISELWQHDPDPLMMIHLEGIYLPEGIPVLVSGAHSPKMIRYLLCSSSC